MEAHKVIVVATPCYDGTVTIEYFGSVLKLLKESCERGVSIKIITIDKDSLVTRARNNLVRLFMDGPEEATHLLFIDSDIGFDPSSIWRMLAYDKDIVCGVYSKKLIEWERAKEGLEKNPNMTPGELHSYCLNYNLNLKQDGEINLENGFGEVLDGTTGFMLIKRRVLFKMKKHYPELKYIPEAEIAGLQEKSDNNYTFFDTMIDPESKRYLSEDYTFCRRWQKIGGKIYADTQSCLRHTGMYTFQGNMNTHLVGNESK